MLIRQISGTVITRMVMMCCGLLTTVITGHRLGLDGLGTVGLVVLGIGAISLLANVLGSPVNVYFASRAPLPQLLLPAYAWAACACLLAGPALAYIELVPEGYAVHIAVLAFLQVVYSAHAGVLMGRERIMTANLVALGQSVLHLLLFAWLTSGAAPSAMHYVQAAYASFAAAVLFSSWAVGKLPPVQLPPVAGSVWRGLARQGAMVQGANLVQLIGYRLVYWLIDGLLGTARLGLYTVANQLAEAAWLAPKSLGTVLYSRTSNTSDAATQRGLTLVVMKVAMACAAGMVLVLLLLPDPVFAWAFGKDVVGIRTLLAILSPGILALSASQAFSHFFSGTGRNGHNLVASSIGAVLTGLLGWWAIGAMGLHGAAVVASLSYCAIGAYQAVVFVRITKADPRSLLPQRQDLDRVLALLRKR